MSKPAALLRLPSHRLEAVARYLLGEIPADCRLHRALDDARLAARVWLALESNRGIER
jgi:DNA polymerase III subunit epsilon